MSTALQEDRILSQRPRLQEACVKLCDMAGQLETNDKLPTMVEMRSQLGISVQTLHDAVRELEKRNVLRSVRGVGIYVAQERGRLVTGNIGFVAPYNMRPDQNVAYWGAVLAGMRQAASERDCHLLIIDNGNAFDRWDKIDGAILCNTHDPRDFYPAMPMPPRDFPAVSIFNEIPGTACIDSDDFRGVYEATKHLIGLGHQRIAYLAAFESGLSLLEKRKEGYLKALEEVGNKPDARLMRELTLRPEWDGLPSWYPTAGEYYTRCWLEEDWNELGCTALIVQNDEAAHGAMKAFQAAEVKVPRDVSLVGFDGLASLRDVPQITTVQVPLFEIGKHAMSSLLNWLIDPSQTPQEIHLPTRFLQGQTTAQVNSI